ncbi:MAG: CHRD domain-containing protein [Candidatus Acidiferrales bacterium]
MKIRSDLILILPLVSLFFFSSSAPAYSGESFKARLSPTPIDAVSKNTITGSGSLTAVLAGNRLIVTGTFDGMQSAATDIHIHRAPKGIRGPAIFDLIVSKNTSGSISGSVELTPAEVDDLENGRFYVQINSERAPAPEGNLWGWLLR